jgi:hypothetical protein
VSLIVDNFAAGSSEDEILKAYRSLTREDIHAALAFAAEMSRERYVDLPLEKAEIFEGEGENQEASKTKI